MNPFRCKINLGILNLEVLKYKEGYKGYFIWNGKEQVINLLKAAILLSEVFKIYRIFFK